MGNTNVKPHPKPRNKKQLRWKAADRPSPPGKPSLNQESGFIPNVVQIHWTIPEKEGGSTVTSYLVEHRRLGTTHWLKSSQFPVITNELAVNGLEPGWRYQFRVKAENAVGLSDASEISEPYTVSLQRSAIAAPKFTQELSDTVILENGKVEFEVHFLGQPLPNICWFKDGFEIFSGNRTRITTVSDKSILTIIHTTAADEGEIKCTATNRAGHASTKCKLTIEATPSIKLPKSYQDQDGIIFEIGETIKLNVTVSGRPTPLIFWSHDGESIQNDDRYDIEYNDKTASVKIDNALRSDRGEYQIKAVNKLGQDHASFLVTITDKPTPPGKARVLLTSGKSVTLCWSTPEDDGGCRIGNYIIEYYRLGWNVWLKAATTRQLSTMLGDLIEGSQYKFRVKAESPYGVSDPSEESEVVFIPDPKRGIREPADVKQNESQIPLPKRRRANSSPRVSFVLDENIPVRPERKKTGKTPEASPRLKRKQISSLASNNKSLGSEPFLNRKFSMSYSEVQMNRSSGSNSPMSWENSPTSPVRKQIAFKYPGMTTNLFQEQKKKSPSPEIIITDTDIDSIAKLSKESETINRSNKSPSEIQTYSKGSPPGSSQNDASPLKNSNYLETFPIKRTNHSEKFSSGTTNLVEKSPSGSPEHLEKSRSRSPNHLEELPLFSLNNPENLLLRSSDHLEKSPAPIKSYNKISPPRITANFERSPPRSPNRSPQGKRHRMIENVELEVNGTDSSTKIPEMSKNDKSPSPQIMDRMRPTLTHQAFSGSSEFMLVLCPEGEQGTHFRKFDINFEDSPIPPPLSLSAPELGIEPPELPQLKRSASSTELLTYHLMERLHEAVLKQDEIDVKPIKGNLNIPTIQVNSEPTKDIIEEKSALGRRLSGIIASNQSSWSHRRHSLKNAKEIDSSFGRRLHKFEDTADMRMEVSDYRKISESEEEKVESRENPELIYKDEWMKDYEESVSSEVDSEASSVDEKRISDAIHLQNDEEEEEIYNPRNRMMSAIKTDANQPFEILTVRKNPPNTNIVPKPILKKTPPSSEANRRMNIKTDKLILHKEYLTPKRNRSNSLSESVEEEIDVSEINKSPTPTRRRSFSLIPSHTNFIKDAFKTSSQKKVNQSSTQKDGTVKNVSALANFTSIAGAGFIIPNKIQDTKKVEKVHEKKEVEEEAKVVVDFYGDIVKNFGGKSKPTAEFSRTVVSKYDTYEERKISDIKPNEDSLSSGRSLTAKNNIPESEISSTEKAERENVYTASINSQKQHNTHSTQQVETLPAKQSKTYLAEGYGNTLPKKSEDTYSNTYQSTQEDLSLSNKYNREKIIPNKGHIDPPVREINDLLKLRTELSQSTMSKVPSRSFQQDRGPTSNRNIEKQHRECRTSSRPGSRQSSVGRRKRTPISRDASTSPVRFLDDWDSQYSSRNSLERDYYNRGSLTSSRASSLSRRSLSPPRPKLRAITTQTSFGIGVPNLDYIQQKIDLANKANKRMRIIFEYIADLAMILFAASLYLFYHEYYAIPFLLILIYRQLGEQIQKLNEAMKKWIPQWILNRFRRKS